MILSGSAAGPIETCSGIAAELDYTHRQCGCPTETCSGRAAEPEDRQKV